ncbi:MAG: bacillithiol biosynthesis deacetylase BshB1 [Bacteroidetes bacterium]|nr:bacillithiol biosynthesis deacetylase BshB1 [Bacteroidota bacterium]
MTTEKLDILAFGAHPDDVELGCSGTLFSHIQKGLKIGIADLTKGELGTRGSSQIRESEANKAKEIFGINVRENLDLGDGFFEINKKSELAVIEIIRKYKPDIVLAPAVEDRHIDHGRAAQLVHNACFLAGLVKIKTQTPEAWRPKTVLHYIQGYYLKPDVIFDISNFFDKKLECIKAYSSQFYNPESNEPETVLSGKDFFNYVEGRAIEMGRYIGVQYAEGFTKTKPLKLNNLQNLI